jgi:hypothetical protein
MPKDVAQVLIALVVLVLMAVCLGAFSARLFISASRGAPGDDKR